MLPQRETLRHRIFVTDAWVSRTVRGAKEHYRPFGLANTDQPVWFKAACDLDAKAAPSLAEIVAVRRDRMNERDLVGGLTSEDLTRRCRGNAAKGYPTDPKRSTVLMCLRVVINEEWEHHRFVVRDLDQIATRKGPARRT